MKKHPYRMIVAFGLVVFLLVLSGFLYTVFSEDRVPVDQTNSLFPDESEKNDFVVEENIESVEIEQTSHEESKGESELETEVESEIESEVTSEPEVDVESSKEEKSDPVKEKAKAVLSEMTLEERLYQLFIVAPEQLTGAKNVTKANESIKAALEKFPVGGIIFFSNNIVSRNQCVDMISNMQSYNKLGLFISVDEEGGKVVRIGNKASMGMAAFPSMGSIGSLDDVSKAYEVGFTIGSEIKELGFNLDFAPVADVFSNPLNTVIGDRAFGRDPEKVASMLAACVRGFGDTEVFCTLKHFPGHGDTEADSHHGAVQTTKTLEELRQCELIPFRAGIEAGAPFVMVGHINTPEITTEDMPASLSKEIIKGILREELEFDGVVITDSMSMKAITNQYSSAEAVVKALQAGADIILMPENLQDAIEGIQGALTTGGLTEDRINESVLRILEMKILGGIIAE